MTTDLWDFATNLYARPGVETACLALQDAGADVCLVLCGLWLDQRATHCTTDYVAQLRQAAAPWQRDVVVPLRRLRQSWREAAQTDQALALLRQHLKQLELDAEREHLQRLQALSAGWPKLPESSARHWLDALAPTSTTATREACDLLHSTRLQR